jgi:hypothetical protein
MFDRLGNPVGPTLVSIPKTSLIAATPSIDGMVSFGQLTYGSRGDILQPAVTTGAATTPEVIVAVGDLGVDRQPHTTLFISSITNLATDPTLASPATVLNLDPYTVPLDPTQPDGSDNLSDNDARLASAVRRVGDIVYATHAVEENGLAAVRWYRINAVDKTLIDSGTITDPTLDLFYPSIAANEAGTVVVGCNGSSISNFVSSYAIAGQIVNGTLAFGPLTLLKAGTASYQNPDPADPLSESRWGDYSATTVDPSDPNRFWTIQMVAVGVTTWITQITELITGTPTNAAPRLAISEAGADIVLSWPASTTNFLLQSSLNIGTNSAWSAVAQAPIVTNNLNAVLVPASTNAEFFRLISGSTSQGSP